MMYTPFHDSPLASVVLENMDRLIDSVFARSDSLVKTWGSRVSKPAITEFMTDLCKGKQLAGIDAFDLCGTHLFVCTISRPWWDDSLWLMEQYYMRLARGVSDPLSAVDRIAEDHGCKTIVFGTSLARRDAALGRMLTSSGYSHQSTQYMKEI
jgi:hypothetical protein